MNKFDDPIERVMVDLKGAAQGFRDGLRDGQRTEEPTATSTWAKVVLWAVAAVVVLAVMVRL
jgi:hypothetical protein